MTPEQATAAIASVRDYRQGLTARAAGLVWMVWGLALAILASADMVGLVETDEQLRPGDDSGFYFPGIVPIIMPLAALAAGAVVSNAIWKAHALERGARHRSWVAWLGILGILAAGVAIGFASINLAVRLSGPDSPEMTYIMVMPLVAATAALLIAMLQRRRVRALPGILAAVILVGVEFLLPFVTVGSLENKILQGTQTSMLAIFGVFVATGLWYYKRG